MSAPPPACRLSVGEPIELGELRLATDGGRPQRATRVTLADDGERLRARFECVDPDPWATVRERDGRLWEEEVVELFVAPGAATPIVYFEFELNPLGAVFDARVANPDGERATMVVDPSWDCAGLETSVELEPADRLWRAELTIPWRALAESSEPPREWRLNLYRVERPRGVFETRLDKGGAEFSAWSPTYSTPADFHRPHRFGFVTRIG